MQGFTALQPVLQMFVTPRITQTHRSSFSRLIAHHARIIHTGAIPGPSVVLIPRLRGLHNTLIGPACAVGQRHLVFVSLVCGSFYLYTCLRMHHVASAYRSHLGRALTLLTYSLHACSQQSVLLGVKWGSCSLCSANP